MSNSELDPRLLEITISIGATTYVFNQEFSIRAQGTLFADQLLDIAEVTIYNVDRVTQDYLLNATSPYTTNHETKSLMVKAGRKSYGLTLIYKGFILVSSITQPPDIGMTFKCMSGINFSNTVYTISAPGLVNAAIYYKQLATRMGANLRNEATNVPMVSNFSFTGTATQELAYWNAFGNETLFYKEGETNILVVRDAFAYLTNTLRVVSEDTGMIGVPEWTELGVKVTFFIDAKTTIGGYIDINSKRYPTFNGRYGIYKLNFNLASRETPFYYIAEAARRITAGEGYVP